MFIFFLCVPVVYDCSPFCWVFIMETSLAVELRGSASLEGDSVLLQFLCKSFGL